MAINHHIIWLHLPFYWILSGLGITWGISEWAQSFFSGDFGKSNDNRYSTAAIYAGICLLYVIGGTSLFLPPFWDFSSAALPLFVLGVVSHVVGFSLRWTSISIMGQSFSRKVQAKDGQKIIKTGPFAYIRHPNYLAGILMFLGFGLMFGNWPALAASLALGLGVYLYRIRIEENFLRKHLTGYKAYCGEVRYRLVPLVY